MSFVGRIGLNFRVFLDKIETVFFFWGTMGTSMVPKRFRAKKYDVSAFKCRIARLCMISRSICKMFWSLGVFDNFDRKSWNSQKHMKFGKNYTFSLVLALESWERLTRRWKAETLNFSKIKLWVPHFSVKCHLCTYLALIVKVCDQFRGLFLVTMGTSMIPKIFRAQKYDVSAFKCRVAYLSMTSCSIFRMIWSKVVSPG